MKPLSKIRPSKPIILGSLGIIAIISFFVSVILTQPRLTPKESIGQKCQNFYNDLASQLAAVENYSIEKGEKSCNPIQDEMGSTDYSLHIQFRVSRSQSRPHEVDQNELDQFSRKLPTKNYQVLIENAQSGEPRICVSAGRYIDNDGKDYPQAGIPDGPKPRYIKPGSVNSYISCEHM